MQTTGTQTSLMFEEEVCIQQKNNYNIEIFPIPLTELILITPGQLLNSIQYHIFFNGFL